MHAVIETSDSSFFQYWDKLCANDPAQNPIYTQQREGSQRDQESIGQFIDRSFLVMAAEEPVFGCSLTLHLDEQGRTCMGYFGREASSHVNQSSMQTPSKNFRPETIRLLQQHVHHLIEEIQPHTIDYLDPVCCGVMSPVTQVLLERGAIPVVQQAQIIDLSSSKLDLQRGMTKSCKGLVEWGRRNLDFEFVGGDRFETALGDHVGVGDGLALEALLRQGKGFLLQARYKGDLVSSGLFVHNNQTCHLISLERTSQTIERPVLHGLIWEAILHSRGMQCSQFDFGNVAINSALKLAVDGELSASSFGGESHARLRVKLDRNLS
jgi:hypothetical protein